MDIITLFGLIFIGGILLLIITIPIVEYNKNEKQPVITTDAVLLTKSTQQLGRGFSSYHLTFEITSKERISLKVDHQKYALFIEGDKGTLTYQGSRFITFERVVD